MKTDVTTRAVLVAAALVGAFLLVQLVLGNFASLVYSLRDDPLRTLGYQFSSSIAAFFQNILPIVIGVFLGFRVFARITPDLQLIPVLVRSLVAAATGAVLALLVTGLFQFGTLFTGSFFGNSLPFGSIRDALSNASYWIANGVDNLVTLVPLVGLAAVLLWLWLRKHAERTGV